MRKIIISALVASAFVVGVTTAAAAEGYEDNQPNGDPVGGGDPVDGGDPVGGGDPVDGGDPVGGGDPVDGLDPLGPEATPDEDGVAVKPIGLPADTEAVAVAGAQQLPVTGSDAAGLAAIGGVLIAGGGALVWRSRAAARA